MAEDPANLVGAIAPVIAPVIASDRKKGFRVSALALSPGLVLSPRLLRRSLPKVELQ